MGMKKVSACSVPRMLTDEQKQNRVDVCTDFLRHLQAQPPIFLDRIVMQDETWVHHFDLETKRQYGLETRQFFHPEEIQCHPICWEWNGYSFWDSKAVIMTDYLPKGSTVTGAYYADELC